MYLKRLELCGFKSFADRTKLDFEPGITAIIGPNGCGKSNTSDGIRWCLGEQSARSMRSHQMMDVIFGGSQSRQTTGMAEVALTFDNSQNILPIDYSEVTVTRRLFRSGESEYFINKVQCRLKDIRDMFLDTGIGTEGYAIIEQGKVEFLLTAKPEDRREMFEEAAGVSKYKVRREETLRKLEKVEIDMNRISDMLALHKEQITSLDTAARKARQYQKYKDELKKLEITSLVHSVLAACTGINRITAELEPKTRSFEELNTSLDQTEADIASMRAAQIEKDERYVKAQDEFSQVKSSINLADERIKLASQREIELEERRQALLNDIAGGTEKVTQYTAELDRTRALWEELTNRVEQFEREYRQKEGELQSLRATIGEFLQQENGLKNRLFAMATEKAALSNEQNRLISNQARCQAQVLSLQKELNRLKEQHTPLLAEITAKETELGNLAVRINEIKAGQERLAAAVGAHQEKLTGNRNRAAQLRERTVSLESKCAMLREWEQKDPLRTTMRDVLSLNLPGLNGPLSSLIHMEAGKEESVAAALGERLNYMVCDTLATAQAAISHLAANNRGRLTFIIADQVPDTSAAQAGGTPLLSQIQAEPAIDRIVRFLAGGIGIDGTTIYAAALVQGGGAISFDKPVLVEEQIRHLTQEIAAITAELETCNAEGNTLQDELTTLSVERSNLDMEFQKANVGFDWTQKHLTSLKEQLEYLDKEITLNENDIANQQREETSLREQLERSEAAVATLERDNQMIKDQQQQMETEIARRRDEENLLAPQLTEAKVAWATQTSELASREREEQKLREAVASLQQQMEQAQNELVTVETRTTEQKTIQTVESGKLQQLHQVLTEKEVELQAILAERQELMQHLETRTASTHTLRQDAEKLKMEIHNLQFEQRSFELQKQNNEQRLADDFGASFSELRETHEKLETSDEEIGKLKRRIESMGAVNLAAPEEYASLEERFNFLLTQQQDLTKAKEDLHQVITKINQNTRENFKKTFDLVREHFKTLYRQLFEGGEADLILTDEANLLECGIDIFAQPPGKKLQNIALLSGGEKALTAIALLFAFFLVKPSPFCILDEVDAPLDDANIGRYINMIKSFAAKSQFLIITHNKRTMEMADVLYGVTMEELGVSKIISVRMNREQELAPAGV